MKELEDYTWFPSIFRNFQTEFIGFIVAKFNVYGAFIDYLQSKNKSFKSMFDLCSGSGEPAITIFHKSSVFKELTLSDKFPKSTEIQNLDALKTSFIKDNCYTMFNAFHHFNTTEQNKLVEEIKKSGANAYFVEILEPSILFALKVMFVTIFGSIIFSPFIKPFSINRIIFTYLIPINILTITYDGLVSVYKSKSLNYYKKMFEGKANVMRLKRNIFSVVIIEVKGHD